MSKRIFSFALILCMIFSFAIPAYAYSSTPSLYKDEVTVRVGSSTSVGFSYGGQAQSAEVIESNLCADAYITGTTLYITGITEGTCYITLAFDDGNSASVKVNVSDKYSSGSSYYDDESDLEIMKGDYEKLYIDLDEYGATRATVTYSSSYVSVDKTTFYSSGYLKVTGRYKGESTLKIKYNTGDTETYYIDVVTSYSSGNSSNYGDDEEEFYLDEIDDTCSYYIDLDDYDADSARITYDEDYVEVNKTSFYSNGTLRITAIEEGDSEIKIRYDSGDTVYLYIYCGEDGYSSGYGDEEEDLYIDKGDYETYYIDLDEYYADRATVTYSSSYVSVNKTTFTSNGSLKITAKKAGESTVKIKYDSGDTVYLYINCESNGNYEPYVSKEDITVKKGSSSSFYVYLEDCERATLSVEDTSVASISRTSITSDSSISVTGKTIGDTRIRIKFDDGSYIYVNVEVTSSNNSITSGLDATVEDEKIELDDYTVLRLETNSSYSSATVTIDDPTVLKLDVSNFSKNTKSYNVYVGTNNEKEIDLIGLKQGEATVTVKFGSSSTNTYKFDIEVVKDIREECDGLDKRGNNFLLNEGISLNKTTLEDGYINGYTDGSFGPDLNISREEFGVMLSRILESKDEITSSDYINDVYANWSKDGIAELVAMGVVTKTSAYRPSDKITREEVAEMLYNALDLSDFSDVCNLSDLYNTSLDKKIAKCCNAGIINGYPNGTFGGSNYITRAEAVTMLNRVFYKNNSTSKTNVFNDLNSSHWAYSSIVKAASR